jgi:DNA mismatch endonuclease Vsr
MDRITPKQRSKLMSKVKNKNTDIEIMLKSILKSRGINFKSNYKLIGKPDIVLVKEKIAVFCDGDFWHGRNFKNEKKKYIQFWQEKIQKNIDRDKKVNKELKKDGWKVLRFWETDIYDNINYCTDKILEEINNFH